MKTLLELLSDKTVKAVRSIKAPPGTFLVIQRNKAGAVETLVQNFANGTKSVHRFHDKSEFLRSGESCWVVVDSIAGETKAGIAFTNKNKLVLEDPNIKAALNPLKGPPGIEIIGSLNPPVVAPEAKSEPVKESKPSTVESDRAKLAEALKAQAKKG